MDQSDIDKIQAHLKRTFGNPHIAVKARPKQKEPVGEWSTWIIRAGRGFGKARSGTGWVHRRAMEWPGRWIALVAKNPADA